MVNEIIQLVFHNFCQLKCNRISSDEEELAKFRQAVCAICMSNPHNRTPPLFTRKCSRTDHPQYQEYRAAESKARSHQG